MRVGPIVIYMNTTQRMGYSITLVNGEWVIVGTEWAFATSTEAVDFLEQVGYPAAPDADFIHAGFVALGA